MTKSALRTLEMLEALGDVPMSHGELAKRLRIPRSSLTALLQVMIEKGYVRIDSMRRYRLGTRLLALAADLTRDLDLAKIADDFVDALAAQASETAAFALWVPETEVLVIARSNWSSPLMYSVQIGDRAPLHASASGQAILAAMSADVLAKVISCLAMPMMTEQTITDRKTFLEKLEDIRKAGDAVSDQELIVGVVTTAAAVRDERGNPIGALSLSVPRARLSDNFDEFRSLIRNAAGEMSELISGKSTPSASLGEARHG